MNAPAENHALRLPPHSIEAEQSLLGGLLLDPKAWDRIADLVAESDFFRDDHRRIFRHIAMLAHAGKEADIVTVFESIDRANEIQQTGGMGYLGEIANATPSAANIRRYAEAIRERAVLRRLVAVGDEFAAACMSPGIRKVADIVADAERRMAAELDEQADEPASLLDVLTDTLAYIDERGDTSGLRTGFADFDALTGGLEPGQLVVVAARPSVGKTLFACNVADNVAHSGGAVGFFTLEMSRREIGMRLLAARSSVSVHAMRAGTKSNDAWDRMVAVLPKAQAQRLWIDDKPAVTVAYIRARARRMKRKHGLDLIVIDYLGLMKGKGDNRVQEIGSISRGLKELAKELGIPVIVLAQLNRSVEGRTDKRPISSDLRDSGEIEQDADIVAMLHREEMYSEAPEWKGFAELIVRKNRNGPLGDVQLAYDGRLMTFSPWQGDSPRTAYKKPVARGFREE
jgi:replicative DNA helicase